MANSQDATDPNIYGMQQDGSQSTVWGGRPGQHWMDFYKDGFSPDNGKTGDYTSEIPRPNNIPGVGVAMSEAQQTSGRAQDVARYRQMGQAAMGRGAPTINYGDAYANLDSSGGALGEAAMGRAYGMQSRGDQLDALRLQRDAAYGNAPSQAQILGRNLLDQSLQAQLAGAASARGGAMAQAAAMRQASQGAASMQQQGVNSLSALRAQEMATARDAYQQGAYGIRAQDYQGSQMATQAAGQYAQNASQYAQMQQQRALLEMQQRQLNDANQQYYEGLGWNTNNAALNAGLGLAGSLAQQSQFDRQMDLAQQQRTDAMIAAGIGAGATLGAGALTRRASGGPIDAGKPVLVGEQGPEVIIPQGKGMVLPAHHPTSITMAQAAQLRAQADAIEANMQKQLAAGPTVRPNMGQAAMRTINASPTVITDAPEPAQQAPMTGPQMSMVPKEPDMSVVPPERLWGGREDPYTADPYYVPLDHAQPTWGGLLSGGREDPYPSIGGALLSRRAA